MDIWLLSTADRKPIPYLQTPFNELHGQVSPDGRWLAYTSDESGTWEIYVQIVSRFPDTAAPSRPTAARSRVGEGTAESCSTWRPTAA